MSVNSLHSSRKYQSVKVHDHAYINLLKHTSCSVDVNRFFRVLWSEVNETILQGGMHSYEKPEAVRDCIR